jgi:hypothetical protein
VECMPATLWELQEALLAYSSCRYPPIGRQAADWPSTDPIVDRNLWRMFIFARDKSIAARCRSCGFFRSSSQMMSGGDGDILEGAGAGEVSEV